jgi:hypothetical protein
VGSAKNQMLAGRRRDKETTRLHSQGPTSVLGRAALAVSAAALAVAVLAAPPYLAGERGLTIRPAHSSWRLQAYTVGTRSRRNGPPPIGFHQESGLICTTCPYTSYSLRVGGLVYEFVHFE